MRTVAAGTTRPCVIHQSSALFVSAYKRILGGEKQEAHPNVSIKIGLSGTPLPWESQRQREARFSPTRPKLASRVSEGLFFLAALRLPLSDTLLSPTPPPRRPSLCAASCLRSGAPTAATPPTSRRPPPTTPLSRRRPPSPSCRADRGRRRPVGAGAHARACAESCCGTRTIAVAEPTARVRFQHE